MKIQKVEIRGLQIQVQEWGDSSLPKLFLLHGWMDCGASFQYMMPFLEKRFNVIAPDLRGFGESEHNPGGYWFPDYFADLEVLLNQYAPSGQVDLAGHSMGGNIVLMYAGIRPERVARVLSLEGFGLPATDAGVAVGRYRQWMQQILSDQSPKVYPDATALKNSIRKGNADLPEQVINDLVKLWSRPSSDGDGSLVLKHDLRHRYTNPVRYNFDEVQEIWKSVEAQVGMVVATNSSQYLKSEQNGRIAQAKDLLRITRENYYLVENSNHMLHLEQPETTAMCVVDFFR